LLSIGLQVIATRFRTPTKALLQNFMCGQLHLADGAYSLYSYTWVWWGSDLSYLKNSVRHPMLSTIQPATVATARMALFAAAMPIKLSARYHCGVRCCQPWPCAVFV